MTTTNSTPPRATLALLLLAASTTALTGCGDCCAADHGAGSHAAAAVAGTTLAAVQKTAPPAAAVSAAPAKAPPLSPTTFPGRDPAAAWTADGALHVTYVADENDGAAVYHRRLAPAPSAPTRVSPPGESAAIHGESGPVLVALAGLGGSDRGTLLVAYPVTRPGKWKSALLLQRSTDGGATWSAPLPLHPDNVTSRGYLAAAPAAGGALLAWLDGSAGHMGLMTATVGKGASGAAPPANRSLDDRTCECCGNAALVDGAKVWVAWRDTDEHEVRDIRVAASADGGSTFAPGVLASADNWKVDGCPHSGPRLALDQGGALWVTWYTGAPTDGGPGIYAAHSTDGGRSFAPKERLAAPGEGVKAVKHPEIGRLPDGTLATYWDEVAADGASRVMTRRREGAGWSAPTEVEKGAQSPRLVPGPAGRVALVTTRGHHGGAEIAVSELGVATPKGPALAGAGGVQ